MAKPLILKISVADPRVSGEEVDKVYGYIENNLKSAECYRLDRSKVTAAAIEFIAILRDVAAVATIADFLFNVWKYNKDKGKLYVAVDPEKGIQIMISDHTSKIEIEEFQRKTNLANAEGQMNNMDKELLEEIKSQRIWVRQNRHQE